jgi:hypothetical protein
MNSNDKSCNSVFPSDRVCLSNICINTLHKGDDDGDDDDDDLCVKMFTPGALHRLGLTDSSKVSVIILFAPAIVSVGQHC